MERTRFIINSAVEFVPIALFVLVSEVTSFRLGLIVLIIATCIALSVSLYLEKRVPLFVLFAAGSIFLFGGLSLYFDTPFFIIIKDTLYAGSFAFLIAVSLILGKPLLYVFFKDFFLMSDKGWRTLSKRWFWFFILLALSNEYVRRVFDPQVWVIYKGLAVLATWVFGFYQLTLTKKERLPGANTWGLRLREARS